MNLGEKVQGGRQGLDQAREGRLSFVPSAMGRRGWGKQQAHSGFQKRWDLQVREGTLDKRRLRSDAVKGPPHSVPRHLRRGIGHQLGARPRRQGAKMNQSQPLETPGTGHADFSCQGLRGPSPWTSWVRPSLSTLCILARFPSPQECRLSTQSCLLSLFPFLSGCSCYWVGDVFWATSVRSILLLLLDTQEKRKRLKSSCLCRDNWRPPH